MRAPAMDIQALYDHVNKRFDQLEELIRQGRQSERRIERQPERRLETRQVN